MDDPSGLEAMSGLSILREVVVIVSPRGRQKNSREAWLKIGTGAFEPVD